MLLCVMTVPIALYSLYIIPETLHHHVITRLSKGSKRNRDDEYTSVPTNTLRLKCESVDPEIENKLKNDYVVELMTLSPAEDNKDLEAGVTGRITNDDANVSDAPAPPVQLIELEGVDYARPPMVMPWACLGFLVDPQLAPVYFMNLNLFSA